MQASLLNRVEAGSDDRNFGSTNFNQVAPRLSETLAAARKKHAAPDKRGYEDTHAGRRRLLVLTSRSAHGALPNDRKKGLKLKSVISS